MRPIALLAALLLPWVAAAQPADQRTAASQLFSARGIAVALAANLTEQQRAIFAEIVNQAEATGQAFRYYGAIAWVPAEGIQSQSLQGAFNFHSVGAAETAARAACAAASTSGGRCEIAAQILPRGYERRALEMSQTATAAFRDTYRGIGGPKAMAISGRTGAWKMAEGVDLADAAQTAVAACNADAATLGGSADCVAAIGN